MRIDEIRIEETALSGGKVNYREGSKTLTKGSIHGCDFPDMSDVTKEKAIEILPLTSRGRRLPMYQVSLCYEIPTNLIGIANGEVFRENELRLIHLRGFKVKSIKKNRGVAVFYSLAFCL